METITEPGTIDDLLADAAAHGYRVTARMVTDWVVLGLLDRPLRQPLGRGKGSAKGVYTAEQRQLFLCLLDKRGPQARRSHTLAKVPIVIWLYYGDPYVPTRQVARALKTWLDEGGRTGKEQARATAHEILAQLDHPAATPADRQALVEALTDVAWKARADNWTGLEAAVRAVFEPLSVFGPFVRADGHPDAPRTAEAVLWSIKARLTASRAIIEGKVSEAELDRARQIYRSMRTEYLRDLPKLAAHASGLAAQIYTTRTPQQQADDCGRDVLLALGTGLIRDELLRQSG